MELIIGAAVSLFIQWLKSRAGTSEYMTLFILLLASVFVSALYTLLVYADLWPTVYQVLVTAGAFYTFVIQRFEAK